MDADQRKLITENVEIIINSAASIHITDAFRDMVQSNYFGVVRILDLADECKKLQVLSHVSTAYVSANLPYKSMAMEKINADFGKDDWEVQIKKILKMSD
jgi:thioester reductase-like protein